jgi:hypothetical protein
MEVMFWKKRRIKRHRLPPERRREPRFADEVEITLVPQEADGVKNTKRALRVRAKNLSPGGLKVEGEESIPVGTVLWIRLYSPKTKREIRATAAVKWSAAVEEGKLYEIGLEFVQTGVHSIMDLIEHIYKG